MKILYVINQISDWSGDSGLLWLTVKLIKKRGHEVAIATTDGNPFRDEESILKYSKTVKELSKSNKNSVKINDIPIFKVHCISSNFGMYSPNAGKIAKKIIRNFDIVHIYSWYHHIGIEFFKAAKKYNIPLIFTAMGTLQNDAQSFYKTQKSIIDYMFTKKIINYANVLHSVGHSEIESYIQYGGKKEKIIQVENGIELKDFELTDSTNILKKLDIMEKPYILFLSRIHPKKGLELLLSAFKELTQSNDEIYLVIAGSGENDYVQKIQKNVKELSLTNKVKFTGLVSQNEKITLLKSAKIFSLISKSDVHPRAIQEALTMGVPVVISKESDYPEVEEYNAGKIVSLDNKKISQTFEKLLRNDSELKIQSNNAKKLINEKFLAEEQIKKFEKIYSDILLNNKN
jgi:glycosyltransferase involved in cell wall biosynthesis